MNEQQTSNQRATVAEFHKDSGGRLTLFSLTVLTPETAGDGRRYVSRRIYDVEHSRKYGYIFHMSGGGGGSKIAVSGIYFAAGDVQIKEQPTTLVSARDKPPWRSKETRAIRARNRTRRLRRLPTAFNDSHSVDLLEWLQHHAIEGDAVYCSVCRDVFPETSLCEHCWWCNKTGLWSTPSERCKCLDREECYD